METTMLHAARVVLGIAAAFFTLAASAQSDAYPTRPIVIATPTTGGAADAIARTVTNAMARSLGASFAVTSHPGAGGNIASEFVARSPADGYTLLLALGSMLTVNPSLYAKVGFDPIKDFEPIALFGVSPYVLAVNPDVPATSVKEFIRYAKARQQPVFFSSPGNGTPNHFLGVLFNAAASTNLQHVPYRTTGAATTDVMAGQVQATFGSMPNLLPFIRSGKLRALAVTTSHRSDLAPEFPTIADTLPGFEFESWYVLLAPAGTPKSIIELLSSAARKALTSKEVRADLAGQGVEASFMAPAEVSKLIRSDLAKWSEIVRSSGIRLD
jgi:tripartite-type tricarboxylate transporter receptor subunit TctC